MKTKLLVLITIVFIGTNCWGQSSASGPIEGGAIVINELFRILPNSSEIDVKKDIRNAVFLELNFTELARINKAKSSLLTLNIPFSESNSVTFSLHDAQILTDNFSVITEKNEKVDYTPGLYYQGTVSGVSPSLAACSMFDNSIMAVFSFNNANWVLGLWNDKSNIRKNIYILYKDNDVLYGRDFQCGADELPKKAVQTGNRGHLRSNQCIKVYFECEYQMFVDKGGAVNVSNYITGMFNVVQALYNVEVLNTEISQIYVWSTADPYIPFVTTTDLLNNFQATRTTFNGTVAHLLTTKNTTLGGLAYLDILCTPSNAYGVSNIDNTYDAYPNYCWTTEVVTHELGHNFGSNHTHWCGWSGGAIDDCYATEGGCAPGPTPTNSGTIMSYCHLSSTGILLTNGFGVQPGGAIRASYNAASCLTSCMSLPDAEFTASIASCSSPLTVTFTDHTLHAVTSWAWDVDNNGSIDYTTQSPTHTYTTAGTYTVKLIATNTNGSDTIIKTNVTVGSVVPAVSIANASGSNAICGGTSATFTATPVNGGANPHYQWYLNGVLIPGDTNVTFTSSTLANSDVVTCKMTSNAPCPTPANATSSGITMSVTPSAVPTVSIALTSGTSTICVGTQVTYSAAITNGGNSPIYQWQVNGSNVGTNSTFFTTSSITNGDAVTCILNSNATCATPATITSGIITMTVNPINSPTVTTTISSGTNPTCAGTPVTFAATSTYGGTTPLYQWKKNGVNTIIGTSYTPSPLVNGDVITCVITSNATCLNPNTATSAGTTISLIPSPIPSVAAAMTSGTNPSCNGSSATFTATAANAGTSPAYQWYLNGYPIAGAQSQSYTPPTITDGSVISCKVTSSATCPDVATSTGITVIVPPVATINFISNMNVCGGNIGATVFSSSPPGAAYSWTNSNTAIGLGASGTGNIPSFFATNTSNAPVSGTITATPSMSGCPGTPSSYTITVNPTPVITQTGTTLTSTTASTYQWYLDGQPIAGAINQTCTVTQNGDYSVIVDGGNCPSGNITITTAGIGDFNNDCFFTVYPNPNDGDFIVTFDVPQRNTYTLKIINVVGALIYQEVLSDFDGKYSKQMNFSVFGKGVYLISLTSHDSEIVKKIIIY